MKKLIMKLRYIFILLLFNVVYANSHDMYIPNIDEFEESDAVKVLINDKNEHCEVMVNSAGGIDATDCLILTNSKHVKVLCTRNKKMCKTEKEVFEFISKAMSSPSGISQSDKSDSHLVESRKPLPNDCKNDSVNTEDGTYSWKSKNDESTVDIKRTNNGSYYVKGESYSGTNSQNGPQMYTIEFVTLPSCGKLKYKDQVDDYTFTLTPNSDGSFDVQDQGSVPAYFAGHFTKSVSNPENKNTTTTEDKAIENQAYVSVEEANEAIDQMDKDMEKANEAIDQMNKDMEETINMNNNEELPHKSGFLDKVKKL